MSSVGVLYIRFPFCTKILESFFETLLERNHRPRRDIHRVIYYSLFGIDVSRNANTYFGYFRRYNLIVFNESEVDSRSPDVDSKKH